MFLRQSSLLKPLETQWIKTKLLEIITMSRNYILLAPVNTFLFKSISFLCQARIPICENPLISLANLLFQFRLNTIPYLYD